MNGYLKYLPFIIMLALSIYSCNAPKNNPLDPENPDNKIFLIEGTVESSNLTPKPVAEVSIVWQNENIQTLTDSNGYFKIRCANKIDGWLYFLKQGFTYDSILVFWGLEKKILINNHLNSEPFLENINFYSEIRNKYSQKEQYLVIEAEIIDEDNNVDSVFLECTELNIIQKLEKNDFKKFSGRFSNYNLSLSSIEEVIGRDFFIKIKDAKGKFFTVGKTNIKRIINQEIEFISPSNQDSVNSTPVLRWRPFKPGFEFSFTAEVYTNEPEPQLVWKKENILSTQVSVNVDTPLIVTESNDLFYWVIWCIDKFNNKSRSKPASFVVKK
jgi:hypothetical protein